MCLFCDIIKGDIPSYKIKENDECYAFLDISNKPFGHTLVVPKKHIENMMDADNETIIKCFEFASNIMKEYVNEKGFTGAKIQVNNGKTAGQEVMHMHIHIMPYGYKRKERDIKSAYEFLK